MLPISAPSREKIARAAAVLLDAPASCSPSSSSAGRRADPRSPHDLLPAAAARSLPLACCSTLSVALSLAFVASACSIHVPIVPAPEAPPPALAIAGPADGLVYTPADDEDPALAGIQLALRVDVEDEAIERVDLALPKDALDELSDVVAADLDGRRAAFFVVTLDDAPEHPVIASARALDLAVEVQAVLVAAR